MQNLRGKIYIYVTAICLLVFLIFSSMFGGASASADVAASPRSETGSDVLADLQKDKSFNAADYPANGKDYSLKLIQIAESTAGELLIYVYQPAAESLKLNAVEIRFSTSIGDNYKPIDYKLTFLNRSGVFAKYSVNDYTVKKDVVRYYDVIHIARAWNKNIDPEHGSNDSNTVVYTVAARFTACTLNGSVSYTRIDIDVIEVIPESKHVGYFRFFEGLGVIISYSNADCWYVGFDTDRPIDTLKEAEISFKTRTVERNYIYGVQSSERFGEWQPFDNYIIKGTDKGTAGNGFLAHHYEWNRIVSIDEFTTNPDYKLSETEKQNMRGCKWVLRFYETEWKKTGDYKTNLVESSEVSYVTVLRLNFETDGVTYNLGVVDNKQSPKPGQLPGNYENSGCDMDWRYVLIIIAVVVFILLIIFFPGIITFLGKVIFWIICLPFRILWAVICAPFRMLKKRREKRRKALEKERLREEKRTQRNQKKRKAKPAESVTAPAASEQTEPKEQTSSKKKRKKEPRKSEPKERVKDNAKKGQRKEKAAKDTPRGNS